MANLRSGELAKRTGVSPDTLRHYERLGLLARPGRSTGGYRQYPPEAEARVRLIRNALAAGFSLTELTKVLRVRDSGGAPCGQVRSLLAEKIAQAERRIEETIEFRNHLTGILDAWDQRLSDTPEGSPAGLLQALDSLPKISRMRGEFRK